LLGQVRGVGDPTARLLPGIHLDQLVWENVDYTNMCRE
jgi:hypothetical protein